MSTDTTPESATTELDAATTGARSGSPGSAIRFGSVVLDSPDPRALGEFYAELLGWTIDEGASDETWVKVRGDGPVALACQLAPDLIKPTWPDPSIPQQHHLDLFVSSYEETEAKALALGATLLDASEDHDDFRVYADPSGHPFCLCLEG